MTREDIQAWLDRYVEAWRSYDAEAIGSLFADDAEYRYHPWGEPLRGRAAIVADWLAPEGDESRRDDPATWRATYRPLAVDGDLAVATGSTDYLDAAGGVDRTYENLWVMRFDGSGRCRDFTEWFMKRP